MLIVGDRRRPGVSEGVRHHRAFLEAHLDVVAEDLDETVDLSTADADLILVFGGDGSILHVTGRLGRNPIPVLGVNYGRFGFLADLAPDGLEAGILRWLAGDFVTSERARLLARLKDGDRVVEERLAFNDVVVGSGELGKMVDVDVIVDGDVAISFSGDGLILATATGSTAHAMAAGGPLLDPTVNAIVVVPIAPHSLSTRPLVLSGAHTITLSVAGSRAGARYIVDGGAPAALDETHQLEVADAHAPVQLVRASGRPFYDALRAKLGWRGRPDYRLEPDAPSSGGDD